MQQLRHGSLPTRGAWIEILGVESANGLVAGRSPHGERGLKSACRKYKIVKDLSLPTRGAWIEISVLICWAISRRVAPHTGSVD